MKKTNRIKIKKSNVQLQSNEEILGEFIAANRDQKLIDLSDFLAKSIMDRAFGISLTLDFISEIDYFEVYQKASCEQCARNILEIEAYSFEGSHFGHMLFEFIDEKKKRKISDIQMFHSDDADHIIRDSVFDWLTTPEENIELLYDLRKIGTKRLFDCEVTNTVSKIKGYSKLLKSFLLSIPEVTIIESHPCGCEYHHRLIIQGKDSSPESQVEIRLHRVLLGWIIADILIPVNMPDANKGERRSIFGIENSIGHN